MEAKINIFYIEVDPYRAAESMVDRHVVKMVLETAQLLSTAHRVLDGVEITKKVYVEGSLPARYRNKKKWQLPDERDTKMYSATHVNHPSAIWVRQSNNNYNWLYCHFVGLLKEYTHRYGKVHKCDAMKLTLSFPPNNIPVGYFTPPTPAMPDEYKVGADVLASYRKYYIHGKSHLHKYTKRYSPEWLVKELVS